MEPKKGKSASLEEDAQNDLLHSSLRSVLQPEVKNETAVQQRKQGGEMKQKWITYYLVYLF